MSDEHVSDGAGSGKPDATTLECAYAALIKGLTVAAKECREAPTPEAQRSASQGFMVAVLMFLDRTGAPSDLRPPLFDLCLALDELGNGVVEPPLRRKQIGRRPKLTQKEKDIRAKVAFACHLLLKLGLSLNEAARYCARKTGGAITYKQVKNWRNDAAAGPANEDIASRIYKKSVGQLDNLPQMTPEEARRIADQYLAAVRMELARRNPK